MFPRYSFPEYSITSTTVIKQIHTLYQAFYRLEHEQWTAQDREMLEKVQRRMVNMIPGLRGSYEDKLRELRMTTLQRRRERGDMIQTWRILTGKDRVDPAIWFRLQEDQLREGATSTRRHQGYQALLPMPPARLEVRRSFFSNRVVEQYNSLPDIEADN